jgi:hypothetical protein
MEINSFVRISLPTVILLLLEDCLGQIKLFPDKNITVVVLEAPIEVLVRRWSNDIS